MLYLFVEREREVVSVCGEREREVVSAIIFSFIHYNSSIK
jgi:hypothetical protein